MISQHAKHDPKNWPKTPRASRVPINRLEDKTSVPNTVWMAHKIFAVASPGNRSLIFRSLWRYWTAAANMTGTSERSAQTSWIHHQVHFQVTIVRWPSLTTLSRTFAAAQAANRYFNAERRYAFFIRPDTVESFSIESSSGELFVVNSKRM